MSLPQMPYGFRARSNWGEGNDTAAYTVGDVVWVPPDCPAVADDRCEPGLHRVESCFSIDEGPSFYYRLARARIEGAKGRVKVMTDWDTVSDRLYVVPGECDFTAGWVRLHHEEERP